jgi:hypothetical protein
VVYGAFAFFFGMPFGDSLLYAIVYGGAVWIAALALHRFGFDRLLSHPVRAVIAWYAIVGLVMPTLTTILGVPVLVAGGAANADGGWLLLLISNYISDSFSPVSLGLALCVPIERLTARNAPRAAGNAESRRNAPLGAVRRGLGGRRDGVRRILAASRRQRHDAGLLPAACLVGAPLQHVVHDDRDCRRRPDRCLLPHFRSGRYADTGNHL